MVAATEPAHKTTKPFTGWHMFAILIAFFGVVIVVNFTMATLAAKTFGGEVVKNSYIASQKFNGWLDEAKAEKALGWSAMPVRTGVDRVAITLGGVPQGTRTVWAVARHPLGLLGDVSLSFLPGPGGTFVSREALPAGRWRLRIEIDADGRHSRVEADIR